MAQNSIASELNNLLITRDFDVDALSTKTGKPAVNERGVPDVSEADMFSFDWVGPTGKNYGTMVILLDQNGGMTVYFGDNLGRTMDPEDKKAWYGDPEAGQTGFLEQLKNFAIRTSKVRGGFSLDNISRLKYAIAGQAALTESFYGTRKVSYSGEPTDARLMIKHSKPIAEGDKRYRYVESLFIETALGERFRLPFRKLAGGRAMVEHVRQGGNPYDMRGQHISETVSQLNTLSQFRRAQQGRVYEGSAANLVTETNQYYQRLNQNLKHMSNSRGYQRYFESWQPAEISDSDMVVEDLRSMFVETRIDPRIEQALPMLARIQKEAQAMKEADIFESWATKLVEGTWALPDTPEKMTKIKTWMSEPQPLGPDAEDVTDILYDLIGDDALFDQLSAMANEDPTADAVPIVQAWIDRNKGQSPELAELSSALQQPAEPVAEPVPVKEPAVAPQPAEAPPPDQVAPVAENVNAIRKLAGLTEDDVQDVTGQPGFVKSTDTYSTNGYQPFSGSAEDGYNKFWDWDIMPQDAEHNQWHRDHNITYMKSGGTTIKKIDPTRGNMLARVPATGRALSNNTQVFVKVGNSPDTMLSANSSDSSNSVPSARPNSGNSQVLTLQQAILARDPNALPRFGADGKMGPETRAAMSKYPDIVKQYSSMDEGDNPATFEDTTSPQFAGLTQTQHDDGSKTTNYSVGPLQSIQKVDAQGRPLKTTVNYDMGIGKFGLEKDHVSGIQTKTATPADPNANPNALMPTSSIAAAKGVDPKKFAAFQAQQSAAVNECNYTMENHYCPVHGLAECSDGIYEAQLARIKLLSLLK